jgi:hypothetical protein
VPFAESRAALGLVEPPESPGVELDVASPDLVVAAASPAAGLVSALSPPSVAGLERVGRKAERSFFAQPDPLKWTVGGAKALRIVPSAPHAGQKRGPGASIPWITSVTCRQLVQA